MIKRLLVTGCAGFIGSNFVISTLNKYPEAEVIGIDKLTYAGNKENLSSVLDDSRFEFIVGDIGDKKLIPSIVNKVDAIVNFAADSMVDRSVLNPDPFLQSNFMSVNNLLSAARDCGVKRFLQISTQEVYGYIPENAVEEAVRFDPHNLYAACKAGAEMLALSYFHSYGLPVVFTRGANAIGKYQHPEKVTPLFITNAIEEKPLPLYGNGSAVRDYIHVDDLNAANDLVLRQGEEGQAYNVASGYEKNLLELASAIIEKLDKSPELIRTIGDRPGHDYRYYLNADKIKKLGWKVEHTFEETIRQTVDWYIENEVWWRKTKESEDFKNYYKLNYENKFDLG